MGDFKFNSITIGLCFVFALIFQSKCDENDATTITQNNVDTPPLISNLQFAAFLLISVLALMCTVYFLYLKTLEIKLKLCGCRMQQMNQPKNQTEEPRYTLDPVGLPKLFPTDINLHANPANTSLLSTEFNPSRNCSKNEILTWNAHKYLEMLNADNEHVYEAPEILNGLPPPEEPESEYELLPNINKPSTSKAGVSLNFQHSPSSQINENEIINSKIFHKKEYNNRF